MRNNLIKKISLKMCLEAGLLLLYLGMGIYFQWEIANLIFFLLFVILILHPIASRFAAFGAISFLVVTAILLAAKQSDWAEISAIWAYYLMIFTAMLSFSELQSDENNATIAKDK
jgi:hypothetical protein